MTVVNPQELMRVAREIWRTDAEICNKTGLSRTTLWRMKNDRFNFHDRSVGKLVNAINAHDKVKHG